MLLKRMEKLLSAKMIMKSLVEEAVCEQNL